MAYPFVTLNAVSGTGTGNQWTAGGANVGVDQSGEGGTASTQFINSVTKYRLSVPLANPVGTTMRSSVISNVKVYVRVKPNTGTNAYIEPMVSCYTGGGYVYYYGTSQLIYGASGYVYKNSSWATNPYTGVAWTWADIDALQVGARGSWDYANTTLSADNTYVEVSYKAAIGTSTLTLPKLTSSSTGTVANGVTGTSTLQLPTPDLISSGYRFRSGSSSLTLPKLTSSATGTKSAGSGMASLTLPSLSVAGAGYLTHTGYVGKETVTINTDVTEDTFIWSVNPAQNFGADIQARLRNYLGYIQNPLLRFDIPKQYSVETLLKLNVDFVQAGVSSKIIASRVLKDWTEGTGTVAAPSADDATYDDYTTDEAWDTAGGDIAATPEGSTTGITTTGVKDVDVTEYFNKVAKGEVTDYGLMLWSDIDSFLRFTCRENGTGIPYLTSTIKTVQLPSLQVNATGRVAHLSGTVAATLPSLSVSATGNKLNEGTATATLPVISLASEGYLEGGKVFLDLPVPILVATGYKIDIIGTVESTLPIISFQAVGGKLHSGEAEINLPGLMTVAATGNFVRTGTSELSLPVITSTSEGYKATNGVSDLSLPTPTVASEGYLTHLGTVLLTLPILTIASEGIKTKVGTSSFGLAVPYINASGIKFKAFTGTVALTLPMVELESDGLKLVAGTSELSLPIISIEILGNKLVTGTSEITLPVITVSAFTYDASLIINTRSGSPDLPGEDEWIPSTGSTLGDDQHSLDNIASHGSPGVGGRDLSLQFETPSIPNEAYPIKRVAISTYVKVTDSQRTEVKAFIANGNLDYHYKAIGETASSSYQKFTASWDKNPHDNSDWTWDSVRDICYLGYPFESWCGIQTVTIDGLAENVYADQTYIEVFYEERLTGTSDISLPSLSVQSTGKNYGHGTSEITLPMLTLYGSQRKYGTASATLPAPIVSAVGKNYGHGTASITLPAPQLNATAVYVRSGTSDLSLPVPSLQAVGSKMEIGTVSLTLPLPTLSSNGIVSRRGDAVFDLPMPQVAASGIVARQAFVILTLPSLQVTSTGIFIHLGYSEITLPLLQIDTRGIFFPSGVETYLWGQFKTQMGSNADLNNYIKTWSFSRKVRILSRADYPYIQMWVEGNQNEKYQTINTKSTDLVVKIICKTQNEDTQTLRNELFILDELIKETIESDIQCSNQAIIMKIISTELKYVAESIGETQIRVALTTRRFDEGDRTNTAKRNYTQVKVGLPSLTLQAIGRVN